MASKDFRVPVGGPYTNRVSESNALETESGYVGAGIVGVMIVGQSTSSTNKDQRFLNCFTETIVDTISNTKRVYCVKRPGFGTSNTPASGSIGTAIFIWTGEGANPPSVISAFGGTDSTIYKGITSLGAITGKATSISETFVSTTATLTVPSSDSTAWYYDAVVATMTKISDGQFPGNNGLTLAGGFAHMDGYACIMDTTGDLWASDLNSVTAWTATSYKSMNSYPDRGIGCIRNKNLIMAFGTESVQFLYNAGLTPFPFDVIPSMTMKIGAVAADAITQIADTVYWAGSTPQGGMSIFQYDGGIARISTPDIDNILIRGGTTNLSMTTIRFYGRSFVLVNSGTTTLAYCVEEKMWAEWSSTTPLWYKCAGVSTGATFVSYAVHNVQTSGKVYVMNPAFHVYTDDSVAYTARAQMAPMDLGTNRLKFWDELDIIADKETDASSLSISYSDDDYQNYTTYGTVDLSTQNPRAHRLGASRRRCWVLTHAAATPMRIEALAGRVTVGTS